MAVFACMATTARSAKPPSILFILADDLAWSDLACYGHPWHDTPHLDDLAQQGMRFTNGYAAAPICSASRASILTGRTTARLNFEFVTKNESGFQKIEGETLLTAPPFTLNLPLQETTIPEYLRGLGYETAFFGKWHLNAHHRRYLGWSPTHGPRQQGFEVAEEDFGSHPYAWGKKAPEPIETAGEFPTDSMIDRIVRVIRQRRERPLFLMASQFYVHTPVQTRCKWLLDKYERRVPRESPNRERRVAYAAFVEELDHHVGVILDGLDTAGLRDQTLVVFTSDNGGHPEYTANGPLRGSKWNLYEGGIRVPFIARWPGRVEADSLCDVPVIGYDLLPTFVDLAGGAARDVDGASLLPLLENAEMLPDRDLLWHFPYYHPESGYRLARETIGIDDFAVSKTRPHSALRRGDDKLLYFYEDERSELYDLGEDSGEQRELSRRQPELETKLREHLLDRLQQAHARFPTRLAK
ncbi:MAG: sulfatase [Planctomycetaceae bacterium]|nr:sulfatase [Planctomycetales bacterium]MCB9925027.1 sulfatase [Planctomycetaceae bacterium]